MDEFGSRLPKDCIIEGAETVLQPTISCIIPEFL